MHHITKFIMPASVQGLITCKRFCNFLKKYKDENKTFHRQQSQYFLYMTKMVRLLAHISNIPFTRIK